MVRTMTIVTAVCLLGGPAVAQVHDGIDNTPAQQRIADDLRSAGSACAAPTCHGGVDGIYPPSTRPGEGAKTPSPPAGPSQPGH